ncbi:hypothetical protein ACQY0O_005392 [Thecaphora frezii]
MLGLPTLSSTCTLTTLVLLLLFFLVSLLRRISTSVTDTDIGTKSPALVPSGAFASVDLYSARETLLHRLFGPPTRLASRRLRQLVTSFRVNRYRLTITVDPDDADRFANDRRLHLTEAYLVLFTAVPDLPKWISGVTPDEVTQRRGRRAVAAIKDATASHRMQAKLYNMVDDAVTWLERLEPNGQFHTHDVIYPMMFRMVLRTFGLTEHTTSFETMDRINDWTMRVAETSNSFLTTQFPLLPTPWSIKRLYAGLRLSVEVAQLLRARERTGIEYDDYVQDMLRRNVPRNEVRDFVLGSLVGGVANPGALCSYTLLFLAAEPALMARVRDEIREALSLPSAHHDEMEADGWKRSLHAIPLETWDDRLPLLDRCIKETSRLLISDLIVRRYRPEAGEAAAAAPLRFGGKTLVDGEFAAFWLSSLHFNPEIYPEPERYLPDRWLTQAAATNKSAGGREEFGGWGVGRHPCPGIRFAKVAVKVGIVTSLLALQQVEAVGEGGKVYEWHDVPRPRENDEHRRVPSKPVWLRYMENRFRVAP